MNAWVARISTEVVAAFAQYCCCHADVSRLRYRCLVQQILPNMISQVDFSSLETFNATPDKKKIRQQFDRRDTWRKSVSLATAHHLAWLRQLDARDL
jgi:hypothetical protein